MTTGPNSGSSPNPQPSEQSTALRLPVIQYIDLTSPVPGFYRVPRKLGISIDDAPAFEKLREKILQRVESLKIPQRSEPYEALMVLALEANQGELRTGFVGSHWLTFSQHLDTLFGESTWSIQHVVNGRILAPRQALRLYEDAYVEFFLQNREKAEWLTRNFSDVYDHSPSNVESGFDYSKQEDLNKGRHIHDIAIRSALHRLGYTFQGSELLKVRGKWNKDGGIHPGYEFSPGEVPFHIPRFLNGAPFAGKQWWSPGTIEDFYQRSRILVVKEFNDDTLHPSNPQETQVHRSYPQRLAARSLLRMLPMFISPTVSLSSFSTLPWMLDHNSLPLDDRGLPRKLNSGEMCGVLEAGMQQLKGLFERQSSNSKNNEGLLGNWVGFRFAGEYLEAAKTYIRDGSEALSQKQNDFFPEFRQLSYWRALLPRFWSELIEQGKRPLFLARDGLAIMEYLSYRQEILTSDRFNPETTLHHTLYLPGSTTEKSSKNLRSAHPLLDETITTLFGFLRDAYEENHLDHAPCTEEEKQAVQNTFRSKIIAQFDKWRNSNEYREGIPIYAWWEDIAEGIAAQFGGSLSNVVVVDSDGTGKTAVFVQTLLEYFAKQKGNPSEIGVLLGGLQGRHLGIPNLAEKYNAPLCPTGNRGSERGVALPDIRWPFVFRTFANSPIFKGLEKPGLLLSMLHRTMEVYNAAVEDTDYAG